MRGSLPCLVLVALLVLSAGCVGEFGETETEPEVVITVEKETEYPPSPSPPHEKKRNVTLLRTEDGWVTESGEDVTDECVRELRELIQTLESDADCVGEVDEEPIRISDRVENLEAELANLQERRQNLSKELDEAERRNQSNRVEVLENKIEDIDIRMAEIASRLDTFPQSTQEYRVVVEHSDSTLTARTDNVPSGNFEWTLLSEGEAPYGTYTRTVSPRLDRVIKKVFSEARSDD